MSIGKEHVVDDRGGGGLTIDFGSEASYFKNCLTKGHTSCVNISTIYTDLISKMENKIET